MSDLPPGKGHAKHSDPSRIEATPPATAQATATPQAPPGVPQQPGVPVTLKTTQIASLLAEFNQNQTEQAVGSLANIERLLDRLLKQSIETNYYIFCIASGKKPDEGETRAVLGLPPLPEPKVEALKQAAKAKRAKKPS